MPVGTTWKVCVGSTLTSYFIVEDNIVECDAPVSEDYGYHNDYYSTWELEATNGPVGADLVVHIEYGYVLYEYNVHFNKVNRASVFSYEVQPPLLRWKTILSGDSTVEFEVMCNDYVENNPTGGEGSQWEMVLTGVTVSVQDYEPECEEPPPECELEITGYTGTAPSQRGVSDGVIDAQVSGMTGTTIAWSVGGVLDTGQTAYNASFSGLTAGDHWVKAQEGPCLDQVQVTVPQGDFRTGDFTVISPSTTGAIVAVENPVMVNIGTAVNSIQPLYSINEFDISGSISDVVIQFNLTFPYVYSAVFYSKGFPDRGNYFLESVLTDEVGTPIGSNSAEEIATSLAEAFENDSIISRLYYIFVDDTTVILTSKETNGFYDLDSTNVTITGSNMDLDNTQEGVVEYDGQLSSNYSVYTELFIDDQIEYGDTPDDIDFRRITELELPYQRDNNHQFDLSPTLKNFVSSPKINFVFTGSTFMTDMICSYYVKYGEKYPLVANSNTKKKRNKGTGSFNWAINSALNFEDPNRMNEYFRGATTGATANFLNTAPNTKYTHRNAKEFLNIVMTKDFGYPTTVFADINMYDGTVHSDVELFDISYSGTDNYGGVAVLAVGYACPCISQYETAGAKIRSVDITMMYSTTGRATWNAYSETKSLRYELDEQPDNFNVAFLNKLGCYETYAFVGEVVEDEVVGRKAYQKPYGINSDGSATAGFEYNSTLDTDYTKTYTLNTGIIDSDTYYFLQGLIQSNRIYHYDEDNQTYLTILSQTSTKSTNTNEYSIQIQVIETINENNVSQ